jgi:hypothetical protein
MVCVQRVRYAASKDMNDKYNLNRNMAVNRILWIYTNA